MRNLEESNKDVLVKYDELHNKLMKIASKVRANLQFSALGIDQSALKRIDELRVDFDNNYKELKQLIKQNLEEN